MRVRKATITLHQAMMRAKQEEERLNEINTRLKDKEKSAQSYPQKRLEQLVANKNISVFFSSLAVGYFRKKREVASLKLRTRQISGRCKLLREEVKSAQSFQRQTLQASDIIEGLVTDQKRRSQMTIDETSDQIVAELIASSGVQDD